MSRLVSSLCSVSSDVPSLHPYCPYCGIQIHLSFSKSWKNRSNISVFGRVGRRSDGSKHPMNKQHRHQKSNRDFDLRSVRLRTVQQAKATGRRCGWLQTVSCSSHQQNAQQASPHILTSAMCRPRSFNSSTEPRGDAWQHGEFHFVRHQGCTLN